MERVEKRDLLTNLLAFPLEQPTALISWYENTPIFVRPGDKGSRLHVSGFHRELILRDYITKIMGEGKEG